MSVAIPQLRHSQIEGRKLGFTANFTTKNPNRGWTMSFGDEEVALIFEDFWTYSFYFSLPLGTKLPSDSAAVIATYFNEKWQAYLRRTLPNFERILAALHEEYDPLSNYDSHEEETIGTKNSGGATVRNPSLDSTVTTDTVTWGKSGSEDPDYTETTGHHGLGKTTDNYRDGFDTTATGGVHTDRSIEQTTGTQSFDHTPARDIVKKDDTLHFNEGNLDSYASHGDKTEGTVTTKLSGSETTSNTPKNSSALDPVAGNSDTALKYNEVQTKYNEKRGNIGVTTSQQMLQSELELRVYDALREYIHRFAEQDLFYWTEDIPYDMGCYDWS